MYRATLMGVIGAVVSIASPSCYAAFHLWDITEIYSSADGSVQFVEFFTTFNSQHVLNNHTLKATSTVAGTPTVNTFTFASNLSLLPPNPSGTANRRMLVATPGFGALPGGVMPDYVLPAGPFFNPNADSISINFAENSDIVTFAGSLLPKDGVNSLHDQNPSGAQNLISAVNSPVNFPGNVGSVDLSAPALAGDFNEDDSVDGDDLAAWRTGFGAQGAAVVHGDGDADGDLDVDGQDFLIWQRQVTPPNIAAIPEPTSAALVIAAFSLLRSARLRLRRSRF